MKIPDKLKIGGFEWAIKEDVEVTDMQGVFGSTHSYTQKIFLDPKISQQKKEHTLIHEVMHAIWWQTGLRERYQKDQEKIEEEVIQALSHGMYQVLKDNDLLK